MDPAVDAIDHDVNPVRHFVGGEPFADHAADGGLIALRTVMDDVEVHAPLDSPLREGPVHGLDDVAALAQRAQGFLGVGRQRPAAGLELFGQAHPFEFLEPPQQAIALCVAEALGLGTQAHVDLLLFSRLFDQVAVEPGQPVLVHLQVELLFHLPLALQAELAGRGFRWRGSGCRGRCSRRRC